MLFSDLQKLAFEPRKSPAPFFTSVFRHAWYLSPRVSCKVFFPASKLSSSAERVLFFTTTWRKKCCKSCKGLWLVVGLIINHAAWEVTLKCSDNVVPKGTFQQMFISLFHSPAYKGRLPSLKLTSVLNTGYPKRKFHLPTVNFQGLC